MSEIVINEIMYRPSSLNTDDEYIELHNSGPEPVNLSGWSFRRGISFTFPPNTWIQTGGFLIVSPSPSAFHRLYESEIALGPYQGHLDNSGETVELVDAIGRIIDRLTYKDESGWPAAANGLGPSLERIHPDMPSDQPQSWNAGPNGGTPGQSNATAVERTFPIVAEVRQSPVAPNSGQSVHVQCRILHNRAIDAASLFYKSETDSHFVRADMFDDGRHADGLSHDGIFAGDVPPFPTGTIVEFYVEAVDGENAVGRFPLEGEQRAAIYRVDDVQYNPTLSFYRIVMRTADERTLRTRSVTSNVELDGSFIHENEIYYNVGIRFRGKGSRHTEPKSYRVNFSESSRYFGAIRKLNLNAKDPDRQFIGLETFKLLRMPVPEKRMVSLLFNGALVPNYIQVERTDQMMMERIFGDGGGNLYRGVEQANFDYRGEDANRYRSNYQKETNELQDDFSDIIRLCDAFSNSDEEAFTQKISEHIHTRQWIRWFAIKELLNDREGGLSLERGDDYYIYKNPRDNRFYLLPWDLDTVIVEPYTAIHHHGVYPVQHLLRHPDLARFYYQELLNILDNELPQSVLDAIIDRTAPISTPSRIQSLKEISRRLRASHYAEIPRSLTVHIDAPGSGASTPLVAEDNEWRFFRGRRDPSDGSMDWTLPSFDDTRWESGQGGFGYGDGDDRTVLSDMQYNYSTVFIRKSFPMDSPDDFSGLELSVRVDDGFVAYLNGVEIARANCTGTPRFSSTASGSLEAGNPLVFPIEYPASLLLPGKNTLAVVGLNNSLSSSDLSLAVNLNGYRNTTGVAQISGFAHAGKTRWIRINGEPADYTPWQARWQHTNPLRDGRNVFQIEALAADESIVETTRIVVYQNASPPADGIETAGDEVWSKANSPVTLERNLIIPQGDSLTIQPGVIVRMATGTSIVVFGSLHVAGAESEPVRFESLVPQSRWGNIIVANAEGPVTISHAQLINTQPVRFRDRQYSGAITVQDGTVAVEHSLFANCRGIAIDAANSYLTVRSNTFRSDSDLPPADGEGVHCQSSYAILEYNQFLNLKGYSDAIDIDYELDRPSIIRGNLIDGSEDDGIDIGFASPLIEGNRIMNCADKAISLEGESRPKVYNNLILNAETGVAVKDQCKAELIHNTISDVTFGVSVYEKNAGMGGAEAAITNCVIWNTVQSIDADADSHYTIEYCDLMQSPVAEGTNFSLDPLFANPAALNFRLLPDSPLIDAGIKTAIDYDMEGTLRPLGSGVDIGAYEIVLETTVTDWILK
jgi:hypothetical protein